MSHKKFGPDRFSRFDVYWIQTDRQAKFIYRFILILQIKQIEPLKLTAWLYAERMYRLKVVRVVVCSIESKRGRDTDRSFEK